MIGLSNGTGNSRTAKILIQDVLVMMRESFNYCPRMAFEFQGRPPQRPFTKILSALPQIPAAGGFYPEESNPEGSAFPIRLRSRSNQYFCPFLSLAGLANPAMALQFLFRIVKVAPALLPTSLQTWSDFSRHAKSGSAVQFSLGR